MRKIFILISFLVSLVASSQQIQTLGNAGNKVVIQGIGQANKSFGLGDWADTTAANLDPFVKLQAGTFIRTGNLIWQRSSDLTTWISIGSGSLVTDQSSSVLFTGVGSSGSPLIAEVNVSTQQGNALSSNGDGLFVRNLVQDGITEPGVITWISGYNYDVSPAVGVIGGVEYTSAWTPITLAASDPTNDRIDLVVFNAGVGSSTGTITVITGTPAADPQQPTVADPSTQLAMAFILVTANTTQPPTPPTQDWIYINNTEWTTLSSTARINPASTSNPYSATLDVEATLAQNGDNIRFTSVTPPTISNFNVLTFKIRSKSIWALGSRIGIRFYSGGTAIGSEVALSNGLYGFSSSSLLGYQLVSIPLSDFGPLLSVTNVLFTVRTTGSRTIGFYLDDIQLQGAIVPSTGYTASNGITLVGSDFQLGGTFTKNTTLTSSGFGLTISGSAAASNLTVNNTHATGNGITVTTQAGTAVSGSSSTGVGVIAENSSTVVDAVTNALQVSRKISGAPSAGIGGAIEYLISTNQSPFTPQRSNRLISTWTDEFLASRTAEFKITGVNSAVESDLFTLSGSGALKLNKYTTSAFTGTPVNTLQTDASGNIIQGAVSISGITADNGLTANTSTNVRLGGTLIQTTTINTAGFETIWTGANTSTAFSITNTSSGGALAVTSTSNTAISGTATTGKGGNFQSTDGNGMEATTSSASSAAGSFNVIPASTNTIRSILNIGRLTTGTAANGIGGNITYTVSTNGGGGRLSNELISKWTDAIDATRTSQFIITGVNSATTADLFTLSGNGALKLNAYTTSAITGTPTNILATDASGNVIQTSLGGTADNGLTMSTAINVQLGSTSAPGSALLHNSFIDAATFYLQMTGTAAQTLRVDNTGSGNAIAANSTTGNGLNATASSSGIGVSGSSSSGAGVLGQSTSANGVTGISSSSYGVQGTTSTGVSLRGYKFSAITNDVTTQFQLSHGSSGTTAAGFGNSFDYQLQDASGIERLSTTLISKWTDATAGTRTSQFIITGVNSAVTQDIIYFEGNGRTRFNGRAQYQQGADVASVAGAIATGLDGNVFELTGTNAVTLISNLNWQNGSMITFVFTSTATLTDGTANSGTDIGMELAGNVNFVGSADDAITLLLSDMGGVQKWREVSRSVN